MQKHLGLQNTGTGTGALKREIFNICKFNPKKTQILSKTDRSHCNGLSHLSMSALSLCITSSSGLHLKQRCSVRQDDALGKVWPQPSNSALSMLELQQATVICLGIAAMYL